MIILRLSGDYWVLPVLGGAGMSMLTTAFRDEELRLTDLVTADDPEIDGVLFERCHLRGPALLQLVRCRLQHNDYGIGRGTLDSALWTVNPWTEVVLGSVVARDCEFIDCSFTGVAFAGTAEFIDRLRSQVVSSTVAS